MKNENINNPVVFQRADPHIYLHTDGYYYMTASVPAYDGIEIRRAKTIEGLEKGESKMVWMKHETGEMSELIWAPEIHVIGDKWYIYFATAGNREIHKVDITFNHRMYVIENGDANPFSDNWVEKGRIETHMESFSLDATILKYDEKVYYIWAQKDPKIEGNSNIYISEMENPWTLKGTITMLTHPEYDWEKRVFSVNEGPSILKSDKYVFLTYSASATDENYCLGILKMEIGKDPLVKENWEKSPVSVFRSDVPNKRFGPGHNSFTKSPEGQDILVYHCRDYDKFDCDPLYDPNRHTCIQVVEWENGEPKFGIPLPLKRKLEDFLAGK